MHRRQFLLGSTALVAAPVMPHVPQPWATGGVLSSGGIRTIGEHAPVHSVPFPGASEPWLVASNRLFLDLKNSLAEACEAFDIQTEAAAALRVTRAYMVESMRGGREVAELAMRDLLADAEENGRRRSPDFAALRSDAEALGLSAEQIDIGQPPTTRWLTR